jgi:transposase
MKKNITDQTIKTIGIDLGDKTHQVCMLNQDGAIVREDKIPNTRQALEKMFASMPRVRIALEAGTHSPWISALLEDLGHEVLVANPRQVKLISKSQQKTDKKDAQLLAKLARVDPELLSPIRHRSVQTQIDQALIKSRHGLLKARTALINHCRGIVKSLGGRLPACSPDCFPKLGAAVPEELREALEPLMRAIEETTLKIHQLERKIEALAAEKYPATAQLAAIGGVGLLTALAFMLVIEDPERFAQSRLVGAYLGLTPKKDQSGDGDKQLPITKAGNGYVRMLLILCAQHMLGWRGQPSELRDWGLKLAERGGKAAKKRAVTAVARRLAVIMHQIWSSGEAYDPYYAAKKRAAKGDAEAQTMLETVERMKKEKQLLKKRAKRESVTVAMATP